VNYYEDAIDSIAKAKAGMKHPVYRGHADATWLLHSSAVRRFLKTYGNDILNDKGKLCKLIDEYQKNHLIKKMKEKEHKFQRKFKSSDMERLSILQHQGVATDLLDFTVNPKVALFFACEIESMDSDETNGKVIIFDLACGVPLNTENYEKEEENIWEGSYEKIFFFKPDTPVDPLGSYLQEIAQGSIFLICGPDVSNTHFKEVVTPSNAKIGIRNYYSKDEQFDREFQEDLYSSIQGFLRINSEKKRFPCLTTERLTKEDHLFLAEKSLSQHNFESALEHCNAFPNASSSEECDESSLSPKIDEIKTCCLNVIEGSKGAEELQEKMEPTQKRISSDYHNQGNSQTARNDHEDAIDFYGMQLENDKNEFLQRKVFYNRGNSHFILGNFEKSLEDFEAAKKIRATADVILAIGNCKTKIGKFGEALESYRYGANLREGISSARCRINKKLIEDIQGALEGQEYTQRLEETDLIVEIRGGGGSIDKASFLGNRGDFPDILPGESSKKDGKRYESLPGFTVIVEQPAKG